MSGETKQCQNCRQSFTVEPEDFNFYKKIQVPPPTWCPECRLIRRMVWRNEKALYKSKCDLCKKSIISMYSDRMNFPVYCHECWWGDNWNPMEYGKEYDFSKPFFEQFRELLEKVPRPNLIVSNVNNCEYSNYIADGKNCYLCFGSIAVEDCLYGSPYESKDCVDSFLARECELCYECIDCEKLYKSSYCQDCSGSSDLIFCYDCQGCSDCIGCVGLRQKQYYIFNKPCSKEEFRKKRVELESNRNSLLENREKFEQLRKSLIHKYARILYSSNSSGNHIVNSKNTHYAFAAKKSEDSKYLTQIIEAKDTYDTNYCEHLELGYEHIGNFGNHKVQFSNTCGESQEVYYSDFCIASQNLFGCISLRNKKYCILNKQYSKEEYKALVSKTREYMVSCSYTDARGREYVFGDFFPMELSPFAYNETVAHEYFPLTKKGAIEKGHQWEDLEEKYHEITMKAENLPNNTKDVDDSILKEVIGCEHEGKCNEQCTTAFKIIEPELQFYKKMNLPLPRLCPNCRHYQRLKQRNPLKLWPRQCMCDYKTYQNTIKHDHHPEGRCPNEFETSYAPERKEIVYCENCYNSEVV